MKKISVITCLLMASATGVFASSVRTIEHSVNHYTVEISKTDTNRLLCEKGDFGKKIYTEDKEFSVESLGNNAFIKISPVVTTSNGVVVNTKINDFNRDLYIECNEQIYSLNLIPKDITAQTIILVDKYEKAKKINHEEVQKFEKARDYENTLLELTKLAYKETAPDGYSLRVINKTFKEFQELTMIHTKEYMGDSYKVDEFQLTINKDMELNEKMFLTMLSNPLAISLTELLVEKGEKIRLLVVSNADADKLTYHEKLTNFQNSLDEIEKKESEKKTTENVDNQVEIDSSILNFVNEGK